MFERLKRRLRRPDPESGMDPVALVLVETTARLLSPGQIAQAVARAVDEAFAASSVASTSPWHHRLTLQGYDLTLETRPVPYFPKDRAPSPNLRSQDLIERHEAAVLLDCWSAPDGRTRESGTDLMGRVLAEIADDTSIGLYCFHTQRLFPLDDALLRAMREGRAYEAVSGSGDTAIAQVRTHDERMRAAIEEARRRWPEFVAAFYRRSTDDGFGVKAPFAHGDNVEHLWIEVERVDADGATGTVMSRPLTLPRPRQGDRVTVAATGISDWSYRDGERSGGGFSTTIVGAALAPKPGR